MFDVDLDDRLDALDVQKVLSRRDLTEREKFRELVDGAPFNPSLTLADNLARAGVRIEGREGT